MNEYSLQPILKTDIKEKEEKIWEIEYILLLIKNIREIKKKEETEDFFLDLSTTEKKPSFDWNIFLKKQLEHKFFLKKTTLKFQIAFSFWNFIF